MRMMRSREIKGGVAFTGDFDGWGGFDLLAIVIWDLDGE